MDSNGPRVALLQCVAVTDEATALQILRLCESLEDDDDVQNVYSNLDIPDELLAKLPA